MGFYYMSRAAKINKRSMYLAGLLALGSAKTGHLDTAYGYFSLGLLLLGLEIGAGSRARVLRVLGVEHLLPLLVRDLLLIHVLILLLLLLLRRLLLFLRLSSLLLLLRLIRVLAHLFKVPEKRNKN